MENRNLDNRSAFSDIDVVEEKQLNTFSEMEIALNVKIQTKKVEKELHAILRSELEN